MKLPIQDKLVVERDKIADYLLTPAHRYGASKARFFAVFGFRLEEWEQLAEALREHGRTHDVARMRETGFGPRYIVEGQLNTPSGRRPRVRSVWQMDEGAIAPRLITAISSGELMKIKEHDCVVLTANLTEEGLLTGDVGTVVHIHKGGAAYEVEFVTLAGRTIAVATVAASDLRPIGERDVNHVRELQSA